MHNPCIFGLQLTVVDTELLRRKCAYLGRRKVTIATRIWWRGTLPAHAGTNDSAHH
jgi:hypothetical protein